MSRPISAESDRGAKKPEASDAGINGLFERFLSVVGGLHTNVVVNRTNLDVQFLFNERTLCRVVPYRELFHVQIGDQPIWETRVRTERGFFEAVDRVIHHFVHSYSTIKSAD